MAELTKNGVCYNLSESPYVREVGRFALHFSSRQHLRRFDRDLPKTVPWLDDSISRRFHMRCDMHQIAVLNLYRQVETRGFYVHDLWDEVIYIKPEDIHIVARVK